jgi:hypothetical protein
MERWLHLILPYLVFQAGEKSGGCVNTVFSATIRIVACPTGQSK